MSTTDIARVEFCNLLGIDDDSHIDDRKKAYFDLCRRTHPDKRPERQPPPVLPLGADVYSDGQYWFTAPAAAGTYRCGRFEYTVVAGRVSSAVKQWSISDVLARLNSLKAVALSPPLPFRGRACVPVNTVDAIIGGPYTIKYANKLSRQWRSEVVVLPPGRSPPYILRGKGVDVLVFSRPP